MVIEDYEGFEINKIYKAVEIYLGNKVSPTVKRLRAAKSEKEKGFKVTIERNEEILDTFECVEFKWRLFCYETPRMVTDHERMIPKKETRFFELTFHKKHKDMVLDSYFSHIVGHVKAIKQEKSLVKLHTLNPEIYFSNTGELWRHVIFNHPATFDTLAVDASLKEEIMLDLQRFSKRKDFYRRVGKAWKRGYLLHGPPGTGKSSLIAAMANFLNFDIYDLELSSLRSDSDLRKLIITTTNRSILVVEDIDRTVDLKEREKPMVEYLMQRDNRRVTLSGLLNFVHGLWSSCGDERIIVFTTNNKEKLDPALLRPGRMDKHIHLGYCNFFSFKKLFSNYHLVDDHPLFEEVRGLIEEVEVTPAKVAEQLMRSDDVCVVLQSLIEAMKRKREEMTQSKQIIEENGEGSVFLEEE
ncbi:hypothetical protein AMTRI_Chr03g48220 [Amborella trichopoda]